MTTNNNNGQLTRSLDKVLDEAQATSELNLSGRKLRDFPKLRNKYDLRDLVTADLSRNRFPDLPCEVCECVCLERLNCYHNVIRSIPETVIYLHYLTHLNLSRNQLTVIPPPLCQLPRLQVLCVSNNKLVSLPEEIGELSTLMELDVSCNEISYLPPQISRLQSLRILNVRRNMLVELPPEITDLQLVKLDIAQNRISCLPPRLYLMITLVDLLVEHNPLTCPPAGLCTRGRIHVFKHMETQAIKEDKKRGILGDAEYRFSHRRYNIGFENRLNGLFESGRRRTTVDSGYSTSDGGTDKRWSQGSQEFTSEIDEARKLALRAAELTKEQRQEREKGIHMLMKSASPASVPATPTSSSPIPNTKVPPHPPDVLNGTSMVNGVSPYPTASPDYHYENSIPEENVRQQYHELKPHVDLCMNNNNKPSRKPYGNVQTYREYKEAQKQQRAYENNNIYRKPSNDGEPIASLSPENGAKVDPNIFTGLSNSTVNHTENTSTPTQNLRTQQHILEAQFSQFRLEEEKRKQKQIQKEAVLSYVKSRTSPSKLGGGDGDSVLELAPISPGSAPIVKPASPVKHSPVNGSVVTRNTTLRHRTGGDANHVFTLQRDFDKAREEQEQIKALRQAIESRLKVILPEDLPVALMDGVVLCHLVNHVRPRSVASIHVPSATVPKLTLAKCRRNVENFLQACRQIGVDEASICACDDIIAARYVEVLNLIVQRLLSIPSPFSHPSSLGTTTRLNSSHAEENHQIVTSRSTDIFVSIFCVLIFIGTCIFLYIISPD